jgi:hypothetical protein
MKKYLVVISVISLLIGCGRVGSQDNKLSPTGKLPSTKGDFDIILDSRFVQNSSSFHKQGHYSLLFKYNNVNEDKITGELYENGSKYSSSESGEAKVDIDQNNNTVTNNILLLLDYSGSIVGNDALREQLIESTKSFIDKVGKNKVNMAIYYFNSKRTITPIIAQPLNGNELKRNLGRLDDTIPKGYISTNLYGAVMEATDIACNWIGKCSNGLNTPTLDSDNFEFSSIVVFTDGRDQAGWATKKEMINLIEKQSDVLFYQAIGLGDADESIIEDISSDKGIYDSELSVQTIEKAFDDLSVWANSFYEARYCPADQKGSVDIKIRLENSTGYIGNIKENDVNLHDSEDFSCDL